MKHSYYKPFNVLLMLVILLISYQFLKNSGLNLLLMDMNALITEIKQMEDLGSMLIIGLMALAIIFNPLPSAPIAMASGAVYGHLWGTLYILIGAFIGANIAFLIARYTSYDLIRRYIGKYQFFEKWSSQNSLMLMVFLSRLIPFISFDLMSYGAGLTSIKLWRFALATLFGLIPVSFLLAHFGGEMTDANLEGMTLFLLVAGLITLTPFIFKFLKQKIQLNSFKSKRGFK